MHGCIVLYCIVSIHLYCASCSTHQSEALPVQETQREESSLERTKRLPEGRGMEEFLRGYNHKVRHAQEGGGVRESVTGREGV